MRSDLSAQISLADETATERFAVRIGRDLERGDTLLLRGPLGAGKTAFCRALIRGRLGFDLEIPSPTYSLVQSYGNGTTDIWHVDLYRLDAPSDLIETGLEDAFENAICLIEWPERLGELKPRGALELQFEISGDASRRIIICGEGRRWGGLFHEMKFDA